MPTSSRRDQAAVREDGAPLHLSLEHVPPTGQQVERLSDGLRLVFELLARRYRKEHPPRNPSGGVRESP